MDSKITQHRVQSLVKSGTKTRLAREENDLEVYIGCL